ncbi:putative MFS multidrug transporter [Talaromyces proteolyticus]|uniref:MFS multidrug transporter n=1 Tax=Talaromyces proteolyticus TaxID=1131652 RepID=A0AAD4KTF4_9EURO|nr:putative MFS multidrug transporter [Talaromyces proteolyticus]KAH8698941.1 putative MFS multidrug transporter [Talaromyces proteolyticus]
MSSEPSSEIAPKSETQLESGAVEESNFEDSLVSWNGADDPSNPHNWAKNKRWAHVIIISILALITNMAPTMCAPGIKSIAADLNITSTVVSTLAITLYVLGVAIGPLLMAPLSEKYGRVPIYHIANIIFIAFLIGNALSQSAAQFMVFRFFSGCAGGTPMALGGGTIADITTIEQRAISMALFSMGPLAGPVLGPVIGGFLAAGKGWRWTFWLLAILGGFFGIAAAIIMRETHPKVILERKAAHLRATTGNVNIRSKLDKPISPSQVFIQVLALPIKLLLTSPILLVISLYVSLVFGVMYLLFTTFTGVFEGQYGFSTSISGLVYLGLGVALFASMFIFNMLNGSVQAARMKAEGVKKPRPEHRLILMIWFSPCVGLGLFVYGWTAYYKVHWIVPIIGTALMGFGAFFVIMPAQLYLIDVFGSEAAASALGANNLLRYISSTFLPLAGPKMYQALNYGWGNSLLGFLALAFVPGPLLFYKYGERLRTKAATQSSG